MNNKIKKSDILEALMNYKGFKKKVELANFLDIQPNVLSNWFKRESFDEEIIGNKFPEVSRVFLLTGEGDMIQSKEPKIIKLESNQGVPYFEDIEATATIASSYSDFKEVPTFYIDYEHFNDCTAYVPIVGDSMYPSFCSGEIIAIKKIFNLDVILWGEAYFVVTNGNANDIKAAKLLFPHEDESKIILRSSNPNYKGDTPINKKDILHLYLIKGKIHRKHL